MRQKREPCKWLKLRMFQPGRWQERMPDWTERFRRGSNSVHKPTQTWRNTKTHALESAWVLESLVAVTGQD
jgi:hypothetical protein